MPNFRRQVESQQVTPERKASRIETRRGINNYTHLEQSIPVSHHTVSVYMRTLCRALHQNGNLGLHMRSYSRA